MLKFHTITAIPIEGGMLKFRRFKYPVYKGIWENQVDLLFISAQQLLLFRWQKFQSYYLQM